MTDFKKRFLFRSITIYLILSLSIIATLPSPVLASFIPSIASSNRDYSSPKYSRNTDIYKIQQILELKVISKRLVELGVKPGEVKDRLDRLTDEEIHYFATHLESLHAGGGDVTGFIISLLIIVSLVLVILHLTGHKIIVK